VTLSVCVFCSSAGGLPEVYRAAARELGAELAGRGHRLVYGGGNVGLMGEVARSVHDHGGTVIGVIPQGLVDRELAYDPADELLVTTTMRERKAEMDARADAFVALPGGFGTLEELLEVLTLRQLRLHDRPIVLVNVAGYWDPFLSMVADMVDQGFAPSATAPCSRWPRPPPKPSTWPSRAPPPSPAPTTAAAPRWRTWRRPPSRTGRPSRAADAVGPPAGSILSLSLRSKPGPGR
jgi:uncharacterized protein (TIGR00730 family)